jgi:hypothetical protein
LHSPASYFRPDDRLEKSIATKHYRAVPMLVKIDQPELSLLKGADYLSMLFLALFFGCLEYTLEEGPRWNWFSDSTILTTAWISGLAGLVFIGRILHVANPIIDLRALKDRNFALGCFFSFVTGIGLFATIYLPCCFSAGCVGRACWTLAWRCSPPGCSRSWRFRCTPSSPPASTCAGS